ncbi:hypothetical protein [Paraburkholderia eburnea]|uniref:hypothetical protein n=1 Tax=Paraburkholderia eburnea TaxID=1189126 RepID=UPI0011AFD95C|nr:hypothetical protein [Paraburkholderia eburnea]
MAEYQRRDWKLIFRIVGMPRRYKYNAMLCSRLARDALNIVGDPEFGCLHAFFERFIEPGAGWEQSSLRSALLEAFPGLYPDSLIQSLGISHPVGLADLVILKRMGIVVDKNSQLKNPSRSACQQAVLFYRDIAAKTGQTFEYVAAVFRASFAWSRFDTRSFSIYRAAVCFAYGPRCQACSHVSYCQKRDIEPLTHDRANRWLSLYPEFQHHFCNLRSTLGQLPHSATDAAVWCLRFETAFHERPGFRIPDPECLKSVRAALVTLPATALQEAWRRWADERFPQDSPLLIRRDYPAEFWPVDSLADSKLPCVLEFSPFRFFAGHGDLLLAEYIRRGETTIPLLAVDWEQVADIIEDMDSATLA